MNALRYSQFFETLTPNTPLEDYCELYSGDTYFEDPFHKVYGVEAIYEIFQAMYKNLHAPQFRVLESVQNGPVIYLRWVFSFHYELHGEEHAFEGVSRVLFDGSGKVISHIDYWDAAQHVYEKLPVIGWLLQIVKRKIKAL